MCSESANLIIVRSDDALLLRTLHQLVEGRADIVHGPSARELSAATTRLVRAVVVDGAASGLESLAELVALRGRSPLAPMMCIVTTAQTAWINHLQPLRVEVFARPLPHRVLATFVERALSVGRLSDDSLDARIVEMAGECGLDGRDLALLPLVLDQESRESACARLGVDQEDLSRALRKLVKKCRVRSTDRLAKILMRDALLCSKEGATAELEPFSERAASF